MFAYPQKFGEREIRQGGITCEFYQSRGAHPFCEFSALNLRSNIAPNDCRPDHARLLIQHHGAVHLAREANATDVLAFQAACLEGSSNSLPSGAPPVIGVLISPSYLRGCELLMLCGGRSENTSLLIDDERPCAAGADVDTQNLNGESSWSSVSSAPHRV